MGIEEPLIPTTEEASRRAFYLVGMSQASPDLRQRRSVKRCMKFPLNSPPVESLNFNPASR